MKNWPIWPTGNWSWWTAVSANNLIVTTNPSPDGSGILLWSVSTIKDTADSRFTLLKMNFTELQSFLNEKADLYNHPDFIGTDPIQIPHLFTLKEDIEIVFDQLAGLPVLAGSLAQVSCEVVAEHVEGDHTLFIGKVLDIKVTEGEPLIFYSGKYRELNECEVKSV